MRVLPNARHRVRTSTSSRTGRTTAGSAGRTAIPPRNPADRRPWPPTHSPPRHLLRRIGRVGRAATTGAIDRAAGAQQLGAASHRDRLSVTTSPPPRRTQAHSLSLACHLSAISNDANSAIARKRRRALPLIAWPHRVTERFWKSSCGKVAGR
jgi:hypothetical protein